MHFKETKLQGCFIIDPNKLEDNRGYFARTYCENEFHAHGIDTEFPQCNTVNNHNKYTLRGMHYAQHPAEESKLIRCTKGSVFDVVVDLRRDSMTFLKWISIELSCENQRMLFVPPQFAHGYLSLEDDTDLFYQMGDFFKPDLVRGLRWNDPTLAINWPYKPEVISEKDSELPLVSDVFVVKE